MARSQDRHDREARQQEVLRLRIVLGLTEEEIRKRLAEGGRDVSRSTISRDLARVRARCEEAVGPSFNPKLVIGEAVAQLNSIIHTALASADKSAAFLRAATLAIDTKVKLLEDLGLLSRASLKVEHKVATEERIPTGGELAAMFKDVEVSQDELISPAERAIRYGEFHKVDKPH